MKHPLLRAAIGVLTCALFVYAAAQSPTDRPLPSPTPAPKGKPAAKLQPLPAPLVAPAFDVTASPVVQLRPRIRGGLPPRAVRRVREYIETHLEETISIQALADIAGLSMFHFARAFKQSEGMTPHEYLVHCRVQRAKDLLTDSKLALSEIALASGFSDQNVPLGP